MILQAVILIVVAVAAYVYGIIVGRNAGWEMAFRYMGIKDPIPPSSVGIHDRD